MNALIHFGMPKTGTTSIQKTLHSLSKQGNQSFSYLGQGRANANRLIVMLFGGGSPQHIENVYGIKAHQLAEQVAEMESLFKSELASAKGKLCILSSEILHFAEDTGLVKLHNYFSEAGLQAQAAGYIRPPKAFMESAFQQRVKTGMSQLSTEKLFPAYRKNYEKLEAAFGRDNVKYWLFDPAQFKEGCVVRDFCERTGIPVKENQIQRDNESLSLPAVSLLYAYRKYGSAQAGSVYSRGSKALVHKLHSLSGPKLRFHSDLIASEIEKNRSEIEWIEERLGAPLAEDIYIHDAQAIRSEEDLLTFSPEALDWLAQELGQTALAEKVRAGEPTDVARGMRQLQTALEAKLPAAPKQAAQTAVAAADTAPERLVDMDQIILSLRNNNVEFGALSDKSARKLVVEALRAVRADLDANRLGKVRVPGLGALSVGKASPKEKGAQPTARNIVVARNSKKP